MKTNNKAVAVRNNETSLKAFTDAMNEAGMVAKSGGTPWLNIDIPGGWLIATVISITERPSKKYGKKNMETHLLLDVQKGYGKTGRGESDLVPGKYDLRADGNIPKYLERENVQEGTLVAFHFKEKQVFKKGTDEAKKFPKGAKSYQIYDMTQK